MPTFICLLSYIPLSFYFLTNMRIGLRSVRVSADFLIGYAIASKHICGRNPKRTEFGVLAQCIFFSPIVFSAGIKPTRPEVQSV